MLVGIEEVRSELVRNLGSFRVRVKGFKLRVRLRRFRVWASG